MDIQFFKEHAGRNTVEFRKGQQRFHLDTSVFAEPVNGVSYGITLWHFKANKAFRRVIKYFGVGEKAKADITAQSIFDTMVATNFIPEEIIYKD